MAQPLPALQHCWHQAADEGERYLAGAAAAVEDHQGASFDQWCWWQFPLCAIHRVDQSLLRGSSSRRLVSGERGLLGDDDDDDDDSDLCDVTREGPPPLSGCCC